MACSIVRNGDVVIRYAVRGGGPPVVLLHGFAADAASWPELGYVDALVAAGRSVVAIDGRGHGGSGGPHNPRAYAPDRLAGDVAAVLDALQHDRADILGYALGGWTALCVARHFPDRVNRLVVGGAHPFGHSMACLRDALAFGIEGWIAVNERLAGPLARAVRLRIAGNDLTALQASLALDRPDISFDLAWFDRPSLLFAGEKDPLRGNVERCARLLTRGRFAAIPGCNHVTTLLRAERVLPQVLGFLAEGAEDSAAPNVALRPRLVWADGRECAGA